MKNFFKLIFLIVVCLAVGGIGAIFTTSSITSWYATINKPLFSPPNWIFAPVWTILYILMGISLYLILKKGFKTKRVRDAVFLFAIQLILNGIWSPVFFGARNILLGLIVIILLWIFVLKTIFAFSRVDKIASYLLVPYIFWVSFAAVLNFSVWLLNR